MDSESLSRLHGLTCSPEPWLSVYALDIFHVMIKNSRTVDRQIHKKFGQLCMLGKISAAALLVMLGELQNKAA